MILYINNFRGFKNTFIPIKDVNFLVGENSTGKTSVLKLIKLLSTYEFWEYQRFRTEWFNFESFDEICSDRKGKSFEIGFFLDGISPIANPGGWALHLKFIKSIEGFPRVENIRWLADGIDIEISEIQWEKTIKAKYRFGLQEAANHNAGFSFKNWITKNSLRKSKYENCVITILGENKSMFKIFEDVHREALSILIKNKEIRWQEISHSIQEALAELDNIWWSAPIRSAPLPVYTGNVSDNADGSHIPHLLRFLFKSPGANSIKSRLQSFGKESGLFNDISIRELDSLSFVIEFELENKQFNITNVGYGISQVLPIVVETIRKKARSWFAFQEPEIHMHPKGQVALGDLFYESWLNENKKFFIETQSDYLVDRFRISMSKNKKNYKRNSDKCQVLFFKRGKDGNEVYPIEIEPDGKYGENRPDEFGEFFAKESMDLYSLNFD